MIAQPDFSPCAFCLAFCCAGGPNGTGVRTPWRKEKSPLRFETGSENFGSLVSTARRFENNREPLKPPRAKTVESVHCHSHFLKRLVLTSVLTERTFAQVSISVKSGSLQISGTSSCCRSNPDLAIISRLHHSQIGAIRSGTHSHGVFGTLPAKA